MNDRPPPPTDWPGLTQALLEKYPAMMPEKIPTLTLSEFIWMLGGKSTGLSKEEAQEYSRRVANLSPREMLEAKMRGEI